MGDRYKEQERREEAYGPVIAELKKVRVGEIRHTWAAFRPGIIRRTLEKIIKWTYLNIRTPLESRKYKILKKSLTENGYNPEKYGYVEVETLYPNTDQPYRARDGNHRTYLLKEIYGNDYEITVNHLNSGYLTKTGIFARGTSEQEQRDLEQGKIFPGGELGLFGKLLNAFKTIPILYYPTFIFFMWYMFVPLMLACITMFVLLQIIPDPNFNRVDHVHPFKILKSVYNKSQRIYEWIVTLYYNYRNMIILSVLLYYIYYLLTNYFYEFLILGVSTALISLILTRLKIDTQINFHDLRKRK
tara:strand:- start:5551 stop:6453 length:903 start_codon:yes stop_codon:yes gene_type:complete